jgi:hypothetical protein
MAELQFTSHLRNLVPGGAFRVAGATVGEALEAPFAEGPQVRGGVFEDRGRPRRHVCVLADGVRLQHRAALSRGIGARSKLFVMQALSGGSIMGERMQVSTRKGLHLPPIYAVRFA